MATFLLRGLLQIPALWFIMDGAQAHGFGWWSILVMIVTTHLYEVSLRIK